MIKVEPTIIAEIVVHLNKVLFYGYAKEDTLFPPLRQKLEALRRLANAQGLIVITAECFRTFARQDQLYAQGRTAPGAVVTNARGGQSYHNYGLAFDLVLGNNTEKKASYAAYSQLAGLARSLDLVWGGDWGDLGHFEYHPGFDWKELAELYSLK